MSAPPLLVRAARSGYLEIVPVELLTPTDWTVDQAMSFIISGGAVAPDSMPFTRSGDRIA